jgi:thiosulfate dehydrogenase
MFSFAITVVITVAIIGAAVALIFNTFVTTRPIPAPASPEAMKLHGVSQSASRTTFNPPPLVDAPANMQDAVNRGHKILMDTRGTLPEYTGNKLNCKNCHFEAGKIRETVSLVGVAAVYPQYGRDEGYSVDLVERTNNCLVRNLNGKPLPSDGKDMQAIMAYYHWISKGVPIYAEVPWLGLEPIQSEHTPDVQAGGAVFAKCAPCHGQNGQGHLPDDGPPLWGDESFTTGSSMAHTDVLASFVHRFMPKGNPDLTTAQALDVAAYVLSHPRPQMKSMGSSNPSNEGK